jgi:hypothetical protein
MCIVQDGHDEEDDFLTYRHFKSGDMRNVVDHLTLYKGVHREFESFSRGFARKVKGVRVHCKGAEDIQYTATSYPQDYPFSKDFEGTTMFCCGLTYYEVPKDKSIEINPIIPWINSEATNIGLMINPEHKLMTKQVNYQLVRKDGLDLLPQQVEACCLFISGVYKEWETKNRADGPPLDLDQRITEATWEGFWEDFKAKKGLGENVENPVQND